MRKLTGEEAARWGAHARRRGVTGLMADGEERGAQPAGPKPRCGTRRPQATGRSVAQGQPHPGPSAEEGRAEKVRGPKQGAERTRIFPPSRDLTGRKGAVSFLRSYEAPGGVLKGRVGWDRDGQESAERRPGAAAGREAAPAGRPPGGRAGFCL